MNYNDQIVLEESEGLNRYITKVFAWMFFGLMLTAMSTFVIIVGIGISEAFAQFIASLSQVILIVFILQMLLVGFISVRLEKISTGTATFAYLTYAIVNGFTIGLWAWLQAGDVIVAAFGITAISFGVMAVYGLVTKQDLTKIGSLLVMGLIGLVIVSLANIFIGSDTLDFIICVAGLFIFLGLTAYRTSQIKDFYYSSLGDSRMSNNLAIIGALMLYLSFVNLFMFILRLLGGGRR
ncbi:MAG: Bax inhibitor-1/YccA family protein [Turicibacter sp.]|nr:Bax inhibitor-1/YccA family protein [Turicibacter sp.]